MRAILFLLLIGSCLQASVAPYSIEMASVDSTGTTLVTTFIGPVSGGYILYYNPVTQLPDTLAIGANLSVSSGTLNASSSPSRSFSSVTRAIGTAYQINTLRDAVVNYGTDITISSLLGTTTGTLTLQYADNSGMTVNLVTVMTSRVSIGGLASLSTINTANLSGVIPAGKWVKITSSSTGSPTYGTPTGQEVLE